MSIKDLDSHKELVKKMDLQLIDFNKNKEGIRKIQLEILLEVDRICKKHHIPYQLFAGTLLGAVRHKGFIPWDDDLDICMLRKDYERFIEVCKQELETKFFLQTCYTEKDWYSQFAKVRRNNSSFVQYIYLELDIHYGIFIDIFPLDNVKPNTVRGTIQRWATGKFYKYCKTRTKYRLMRARRRIRYYNYFFHYALKPLPKKVMRYLHKKTLTMFNGKETEYVTHLTNTSSLEFYSKHLIKREDFYDMIEGEFEGYKVPIPRSYDKVLTQLYGDYMELPPKSRRIPHHFIVEVKFPPENEEKIITEKTT